MRLRLDKLVLSAGLALAMVATTIPVGAAVGTTEATSSVVTGSEGLATNDGKAVSNDDFAAAITGVSKATENQSITDVSGLLESKGKGEVVSNITVGRTVLATTDIKNLDTSYTFADKGNSVSGNYVITQETVYETKGYKYTLVSDEVTENQTDAEKNDVNVSADDIIASIVEYLGIKETTAPEKLDYGTKTVVVVNDTASGLQDYTEIKVTTKVGDEVSIPDGRKVIVRTTYNVTTLPSGYRYDILLGNVDTDKKDFVVAVANLEDGSEKLVTDYTETKQGIIVSTTTLGDKVFYLGTKDKSISGALLFAPTTGNDSTSATVTSGDDIVATIAGGTSTANTADYTKATNAPESATVVGYFTINVKKAGATVTDLGGATLEFKIAVPTDVTPSEGKKINWMVVRTHNGEVDILPATEVDGYIVFSTGYFSDYALIYTEVAADTAEDPTQEEQQQEEQQQESATTPEGSNGSDSPSSAKGSSAKTADNSMMSLFMTTLLLALCAGSLAIYKEKKTN